MQISDSGLKAINNRYAATKPDGHKESWEEISERVAQGMVKTELNEEQAEIHYKSFKKHLVQMKYIPGGRILRGADMPGENLMNCYVIPLEDNKESIGECISNVYIISCFGGGTGISFSKIRPYLEVIGKDRGFAPGIVSIIKMINGIGEHARSGGCFAGDTLISTLDGLIPIKEIVEKKQASQFVNTHLGPRRITEFFKNGIQDVWRVRTKKGYEVKVTKDHKFKILQPDGSLKDKITGELKTGDNLVLLVDNQSDRGQMVWLDVPEYEKKPGRTTFQDIKCPEILDQDLAYLLGCSYGDGHVRQDKCLSIAVGNDTPEISQKLVRIATEQFGLTATITLGDGACHIVNLYSRRFTEFLKYNNLLKEKTASIQVPGKILESPQQVQMAFVAGYFDADGSCGDKNGFVFSSITKDFLEKLQVLLAHNGIGCYLHKPMKREGIWQDLYRLSVSEREFENRFYTQVAPFSKKIRPVRNKKDHSFKFSSCDPVSLGMRDKEYEKIWARTNNGCSYSTMYDLLSTRNDSSGLKHLLEDKIESIEHIGQEATYDLEVDEVHCLSGNGIYTSNSRRAALIGILDVSHPDIFKFLECKDKDGELSNFNLSVNITLEFLNAIKEDSLWPLHFEGVHYKRFTAVCEEETEEIFAPTEKDAVIRARFAFGERGIGTEKVEVIQQPDISARDLWKILVARGLKGEPGMINLHYCNEMNPGWYYEEIIGVNPCVSGDTKILTTSGFKEIHTLVGQSVQIWNGHQWSRVTPKVTGLNQDMMRIAFSDGSSLKCTPYHKFVLDDKTRIEARELELGTKLAKFTFPVIEGKELLTDKETYTWEVFVGDEYRENSRNRQNITLHDEKKKLFPYLIQEKVWDQDRLIVKLPRCDWQKEWIPGVEYTIQTRLDWLAGLLDINAEICGNGDCSIWSVNKEFLEMTKLMLQTLGTASTLSLGKAWEQFIPDGKDDHQHQSCWKLTINGSAMYQLSELGLKTHRVDTSYKPHRDANQFIQVVGLEALPQKAEKVYCFNEPVNHTGIFNSVMTAQCAELPLPAYGCCDLGSIVLPKFVENGRIQWAELGVAVQDLVRLLDSALDVSEYPLQKIKETCQASRRIGVGTMGLHHLLIELGVKYGSAESLDVISTLYAFIRDKAYEASIELAKEKGPFPRYQEVPYMAGRFFKTLPVNIQEDIRRYGIRNCSLLTSAPTGTTHMLPNVSSGIEPIPARAYMRNDRLGRRLIVDKLYQKFVREDKNTSHIVASYEIPASRHLAVQACIQKYVDSSISKTILVTENDSERALNSTMIVLEKYLPELKGTTLYQIDSRSNQVITPIPSDQERALIESAIAEEQDLCAGGVCEL